MNSGISRWTGTRVLVDSVDAVASNTWTRLALVDVIFTMHSVVSGLTATFVGFLQ